MQEGAQEMAQFDRGRLIAVLAAGGIHADQSTIDHVDNWLYFLSFKYQLQKNNMQVGRAKPSRELRNLNKALLEWGFSESFKWEVMLISRFDREKLSQMEWFSCAVGETMDLLESRRKKVRQQNPETELFIDLYRGYADLSGKTGLSNDDSGPGVRFVTECAGLLDVVVPNGLRQTIQAAIGRQGARATCKNDRRK
jgi:hypothetical protein